MARTTPAHLQRPLTNVAGAPLRLFNMGANATRTSWHQNPVSGLWFPGAELEPTRTNLSARSEEIDLAPWARTRCTATNTSVTIAPDGLTTVNDVLHEDTTPASSHHLSQSVTFTDATYCLSFLMKIINRPWCCIGLTGSVDDRAFYRLDTGVVGSRGANVLAYGMKHFGYDWYRCWLSVAMTAGAAPFYVWIAEDNNDTVFQGLNQDSFFCWGGQCEAGLYPSSYIKTAAGSAQRTADSELRWGTYVPDVFTCQLVLSIPSHTPATETDVFYIDDGTASNRIVFAYDTSRKLRVYCKVGGATKADVTPNRIVTDDGVHRVAAAYGRGRISISVDGVELDGYGDHVPGMNAIAIQPSGGLCSLQWQNVWLTGQPRRVQPDVLEIAA